MNKLKINSIDIRGIGPIRHLDINFDPHFNVICGANGVGKTTILDCIAQSFTLNRWGGVLPVVWCLCLQWQG